jgi:hypothetical protein
MQSASGKSCTRSKTGEPDIGPVSRSICGAFPVSLSLFRCRNFFKMNPTFPVARLCNPIFPEETRSGTQRCLD